MAALHRQQYRRRYRYLVIGTDGNNLTQLTYHPGNDISAVWAPDGKSIYFLSQRGNVEGKYNVWKMNFNLPNAIH